MPSLFTSGSPHAGGQVRPSGCLQRVGVAVPRWGALLPCGDCSQMPFGPFKKKEPEAKKIEEAAAEVRADGSRRQGSGFGVRFRVRERVYVRTCRSGGFGKLGQGQAQGIRVRGQESGVSVRVRGWRQEIGGFKGSGIGGGLRGFGSSSPGLCRDRGCGFGGRRVQLRRAQGRRLGIRGHNGCGQAQKKKSGVTGGIKGRDPGSPPHKKQHCQKL